MRIKHGFRMTAWPSLLLCIFLTLTASTAAQESPLGIRVSIPSQRTTVYSLLTQVSDSIGYSFVYDSQVVSSDRRVNLPATRLPVEDILNTILDDSTLLYRIMGKHILIYREAEGSDTAPRQKKVPQHLTIRGQVFDYETRKPLPFATIGISEVGIGNVANSEGLFVLRVPEEYAEKDITVSHIGYMNSSYPVALLASSKTDIFLRTDYISIQEVIIRNVDPLALVAESVERISTNFSQQPTYLTSFYREGVHINGKLLNYTEGVFRIYKPSYVSQFDTDQVKLLKMRTISNVDHTDSIVIKLKGGIGSGLALDIARNLPSFLDPNFTEYYNFFKTDIVSIGGRSAYAIGFEQKKGITEPLLKGIVYIDMEKLTILKAEFGVNPGMVSQTTSQYLARRNRKYNVRAERIEYTVSYTEHNGAYHLSHVRGDLRFRYRLRRRIRYSTFDAFLELATSQIDTQNVKRFGRRKTTPTSSVFTDMRVEYDAEFWENLNYIAPEGSIQSTLGEINFKLQQLLGEE